VDPTPASISVIEIWIFGAEGICVRTTVGTRQGARYCAVQAFAHTGDRKGNNKDEKDWIPELKLEISGRLPKTYVQDIGTRVELYARLFKCTTEAQVDALQD
jgi:hypothetical protein